MNHLPLPLSPAVPPLEIPLVADIIYNFGDFVDFPRRHGFVKDDEEYLNVSYLEIGLPPSFNPGPGLEQSRNFLDILWALMSSLAADSQQREPMCQFQSAGLHSLRANVAGVAIKVMLSHFGDVC